MKPLGIGSWLELGRAKSLLDTFLAFFYPDICQVCHDGRAGSREGYVCGDCATRKRDGVQFLEPPYCDRCGMPYPGLLPEPFLCRNCSDQEIWFSTARAAAKYGGVVAHVVQRYKYSHALWFEPFLAKLLAERLGILCPGQEWDVIVPIPLHSVKHRERGFNQAARLGRRLGDAQGVPFRQDLLKRTKPTLSQTRLSKKARIENMDSAFVFRGKAPLRGERVLLIDDVLTTGATANACAKELRRNGASAVTVFTVARAVALIN